MSCSPRTIRHDADAQIAHGARVRVDLHEVDVVAAVAEPGSQPLDDDLEAP